jgi:hypothetical protein
VGEELADDEDGGGEAEVRAVVLYQVMRDTGVQKRRVRKHDLGAVRTNEDASDRPPVPRMYDDGVSAVTDLSQLTRPDSGTGHDVPCRREDDDLPDESI